MMRTRFRSHLQWHHNQDELQNKKQELLRKYRSATGEEKRRCRVELRELEEEIQVRHLQKHIGMKSRSDLRNYYRHVRLTRPLTLLFNLLLWGLLFWLGGVSTGLKIVILIFALASTFGSVFELSFLVRVKDRILNPVEKLKKGVNEIANGNYDVQVESKLPNEISTLVNDFNNMAEKLREAEQLKMEYEENRKALIANISHDLKTPITSIQGYIEALLEHDDFPVERKEKYLKIIDNNAAYMNRLIDDLFLFSKLDMQKLDFHFERISLRGFLHDIMEEFKLDLEERQIVFEYRDELQRDCEAHVDPRRFHQVLQNVIGNAVKYGPKEGLCIRTRLYRQGADFCIDIADNGPGIEPEKLRHIFERFYRVDSERTKDFAGTGLGLAIAKELIESHGGRISAASTEGSGTCFTIRQPILKREETHDEKNTDC